MSLTDEDMAKIAAIVDAVVNKRLPQGAPVVHDVKAEDIVAPESPFDGMDDNELLYYATPYFDELSAKKELMAQHRKEEDSINE